jgi:hypothetical protein
MVSLSWMLHICLLAVVLGLRKTIGSRHVVELLIRCRFWTLGPNWPKGGEIDIVEGVNDFTNNGMTLHTGPGCQIGSDTTQFSGTVSTGNCDVAAKDQSKNAGCSIADSNKASYGAGLNEVGGGVFAMEWNSDGISVYHFARGSIPADVLGDSPNPSGWGKPAAKFAGACDIDEMFAEQQIIIDTTFCGAWAGDPNVWSSGSCGKKAATCEEWVRDNPEAFAEAYWEINALKVYQNDGKAPTYPTVPATPPKSSALPVPAPPVASSYAAVVSPVSSQAVEQVPSSKAVIGVPEKPTGAPVLSSKAAGLIPSSNAVPLPSSIAVLPEVPQGAQNSSSRGSASAAKPSRTAANSPINMAPAPTGPGGMPGWNWPQAGSGSGDAPAGDTPNATTTAAPVPKPSTPAQNTSGAAVVPTPQQNVAQPSSAPVVPAKPVEAPAAAPIAPAAPVEPVHTIYETVYKTVTARGEATPAPAPDAQKARMARHIREHRRRWTQHNARF